MCAYVLILDGYRMALKNHRMSVTDSRSISANLKYGRMNCLDAYGRVVNFSAVFI